jgi:hypothetical protein
MLHFSPQRLDADFGCSSELAHAGIQALHRAIAAGGRAPETCLQQGMNLLGKACGWQLSDPAATAAKLAKFYGLTGPRSSPAAILFAVQSYYALVLKLLAADIAASIQKLPPPSRAMAQAATGQDLRRQMEAIEQGRLLRQCNVEGFSDGGLFAWYTSTWCEPVERLAHGMAAALGRYEMDGAAEAPGEARDLFHVLYRGLFPRSVRRALGEFYTPDWLAAHVLDELGVTGEPDRRILDPACGSGIFLLGAINRIRRRHGEEGGTRPSAPHDLRRQILDNVIGFDLNPLAALAASTNYLMAIRDLAGGMARIEVPIHQCDSILAPPARWLGQCDFVAGNPPWTVWDRLPADYRNATKPLWERYGLFTLGAAAARHGGGKKDISMLMLYAAADLYLKAAGKLGFVITQTAFQTRGAGDGFRRFRIGADGCPLRVLRVDALAQFQPFEGASNWTSVIILEKGQETRYPVPYYRWSLAGDCPNFRAGDCPNFCPGDCPNFRPSENGTVPLGSRLKAQGSKRFDVSPCAASPIDVHKSNSPWLILPQSLGADLAGLIGPSDYAAHAGACSGGANGVYWLRIVRRVPDGLLVANLAETSKRALPQVERTIEPDLLYPLLRWSDVSRWRATPSCYVLLAQDPAGRRGIDERIMRERYPRALAYLSEFRATLARRVAYRRYQSRAAFYSMYDVGPYTVAPIKVVWRRMDRRINAAVVEPCDDPWLGPRPVVPQETCSLVAATSGDEAHYLCALLNSALTNVIACSHCVRGGKGFGTPGMLDYLRLRQFQPSDPRHRQLADLSRQAHAAAAVGQVPDDLQTAIDRTAANLNGLSAAQLAAIGTT